MNYIEELLFIYIEDKIKEEKWILLRFGEFV